MDKTILIAPNSFKECDDSVNIAEIIASSFRNDSRIQTIAKPLSDGGDGFLKVCSSIYNLSILKYEISTPYNSDKNIVEVGYDKKRQIIYIESADVLGMKVIPKERRRPMQLSSKGMGELLKLIIDDVSEKKIKVKKLVIGIGGTGTNDLGIGMASVFGLKLFDENNTKLEPLPSSFVKVKSISWSMPEIPSSIELVTDVDNPLLGENGASKVFGPQKGLNKNEINISEHGFGNICNILGNKKISESSKQLSGAGGGLAAGFQLFFNAELRFSDWFVNEILSDIIWEQINAVITGEGKFDGQSFMKKATGSMIEICSKKNLLVYLVCGKIDKNILSKIPENVVPVEISKYFSNTEESIKNYREGLKYAVKEILHSLG